MTPVSPVAFRPAFLCLQNSLRTTLSIVLVSLLSFFLSCRGKANSEQLEAASQSLFYQLPAPVALASEEKSRLQQACEAWYDTVLGNAFFNGSMLVSKGGNVIFEKYQGSIHLGGSDSIRASTPFHIASVSKTFTGMSVLKLMEQGKLNLDDAFALHFPTFNYAGVTVRTLLNHRSGLPNYLYFMEDLGWDKKISIKNQDIFNALVNRKAELVNIGTPDRNFTYCNTNYALLAMLIEKVSGMSYPQFLKENFFEPLQMKNSFVYSHADSAIAHPNYDRRGQLIPNNYLDYVYGDKNVYSTPKDLLTWHRALNSNLLFKPATLELAYQPYSNERPGIRNYGLGWRMNNYPTGKKIIFHNGWWHGNNAAFVRLPEHDAVIIVLGNRDNHGIYKAYHLVNAFDNYFAGPAEQE